MVKVTFQVRSGAARLKVSVMAESVERAEAIVGARFSGGDVRVLPVPSSGGGSGAREPLAA